MSESGNELSLYDRIKSDLKVFIKTGFRIGVNILKIVLSEIATEVFKNKLSITNNLCIRIIKRLINSHLEAMSQYKLAKRDDKYSIEEQELKILQSYLPEPLTEEEVDEMVTYQIISLCFNQDKSLTDKSLFGLIMKSISANIDGRFDNKRLSELIRNKLNKINSVIPNYRISTSDCNCDNCLYKLLGLIGESLIPEVRYCGKLSALGIINKLDLSHVCDNHGKVTVDAKSISDNN